MALDFPRARRLYADALTMSQNNPIVNACSAVCTIASCVYPRRETWDKAQRMIRIACTDPADLKRLKVAEDGFFKWAVVASPRSPQAMLNFALWQQCVNRRYDDAERFYHRALYQAIWEGGWRPLCPKGRSCEKQLDEEHSSNFKHPCKMGAGCAYKRQKTHKAKFHHGESLEMPWDGTR